jgi:phosphohistidine phosphatase
MIKTLYIARHGEAVSVGAPDVFVDFDRYLSEAGRTQISRQARGLQQLGAHWEQVIASPLVRARQTAELLNEHLQAPLALSEALGDRPSLRVLREELLAQQAEQLLLVTHQPFVVQLTLWLLNGQAAHPLDYGTGAMACLKVDLAEAQPGGELLWFKSSASLQQLA